jgi:hypothetical protein
MKKAIIRIILVGVVQILLFELLNQLSVHWRESTGELVGIFLLILILAGLIWAALPACRKMRNKTAGIVFRSLLVIVLFVGLYTVDYFYYWHIRPNIGLYKEADWVAQHPGFQRQLRARIEANKWKSSKKTDEGDSR